MEPPRFDYGDEVRVVRNLRNDGTFPGEATGALLVRRGSTGVVRDIGTFLQDQVIYTVHFTDSDKLVGCRDRELIGGEEPWVPSLFEFGDKVVASIILGINGDVVAAKGDPGEILKVVRDAPGGVAYHVRFRGRTLQVPETALAAAPGDTTAQDETIEEGAQ
ncbi:nitrogen fixation protein NifZ [Rhodobium gokarnense]|uniref:Nitrogen fixation protein NifZ n=1 Tax=Rhodobium gokarnense TaxID=364296 RepID=A0ABT3H8Z8_9HYPH|nr:nitrogen fixation protein NifZ [Rhodobium gokarnense]MCW2306866.1 nitrogen fixation protein NifZ [Rhodobium gokarnense]